MRIFFLFVCSIILAGLLNSSDAWITAKTTTTLAGSAARIMGKNSQYYTRSSSTTTTSKSSILLQSSSSTSSSSETTISIEEEEESSTRRKKIKNSILKAAVVSGRGAWSRPNEALDTKNLISKLEEESKNTSTTTTEVEGYWELILSDIEPFRASIFFLALASAVEANLIPNASDNALTVHSMATGGGEVGRVAYVIESSSNSSNTKVLHSLVELRSGSLPSLPLALTGTVISSGELYPKNNNNNDAYYDLMLRNTTVQGNKMKYGLPSEEGLKPFVNTDMVSWIGNQFVPSGDIFSSVLDPMGGGQTVSMELTYKDEDTMIWRTPNLPGNHYFCFVKGERENWPEFEDMKTRQAETTTNNKTPLSLVGSAFALGMLNPFFSRRVKKSS